MSSTSHKAAALGSQLQLTVDAHRETIRNTAIESSHSLHTTISEQNNSQNSGSDILVRDGSFFRAHHDKHTLETQGFRQAKAGRADSAGRCHNCLGECHLEINGRSSKQSKTAVTKRQMMPMQEGLLRGIHLSDTDDIKFSWGRDGYNKGLDADIVEYDLDMSSFLDEVDISTLPLDRFLGSRGPWTPMDFDLSRVENSRRHVLDKQKK
jgi:hypothetical protein